MQAKQVREPLLVSVRLHQVACAKAAGRWVKEARPARRERGGRGATAACKPLRAAAHKYPDAIREVGQRRSVAATAKSNLCMDCGWS